MTYRFSNSLQGSTIGATVNRLLTEHSLALLVVSGNEKLSHMNPTFDVGTGEFAIFISTNKLSLKHNVCASYLRRYCAWMDRAVSHLIAKIDEMTQPVLFLSTNEAEKLFFDMKLSGIYKERKYEKTARVYLMCLKENMFEFFVDTYVHDQGIW